MKIVKVFFFAISLMLMVASVSAVGLESSYQRTDIGGGGYSITVMDYDTPIPEGLTPEEEQSYLLSWAQKYIPGIVGAEIYNIGVDDKMVPFISPYTDRITVTVTPTDPNSKVTANGVVPLAQPSSSPLPSSLSIQGFNKAIELNPTVQYQSIQDLRAALEGIDDESERDKIFADFLETCPEYEPTELTALLDELHGDEDEEHPNL